MKLPILGIVLFLAACASKPPEREQHTIYVPTTVVEAVVAPAKELPLPPIPVLRSIPVNTSPDDKARILISNQNLLKAFAQRLYTLVQEYNSSIKTLNKD